MLMSMLDASLLCLRGALLVFVVVATLRLYRPNALVTTNGPDEDAQLVAFGIAVFLAGAGIGWAIAAAGALGP